MDEDRIGHVSAEGLKQAIEARDGSRLGMFYAEDAELRLMDSRNPPGHPRVLRGRDEIVAYWRDICTRAITHTVDFTVTEGDRIAFTRAGAYPDGTRVFSIATLELSDGRIVRQSAVQAWDE